MRCTRTRMRSTECTYLDSCLSARLSFPSNTRTTTRHRIWTKAEEARRDATGHRVRAERRDAVESTAWTSQHGAVTAGRRRTGAVESRSWGLASPTRGVWTESAQVNRLVMEWAQRRHGGRRMHGLLVAVSQRSRWS